MYDKTTMTPERLHYLQLLAKQYPTIQSAGAEIIRLQGILSLPKGTEHFISDIHGEHEAFHHLLNSCSGEVKKKMDECFGCSMTHADYEDLASLVYYPKEKLAMIADTGTEAEHHYRVLLYRLVQLARHCCAKYTQRKVRASLPTDYADVIEGLLTTQQNNEDTKDYYKSLIETIILTGQAPDVIKALCALIKRMTVDQLHIVGDIFDRGPRADIVMDALINHHNVDIQWGNHDILWMGAAAGSRTLVATVLANSIRYNNLDVIETGYGISLRPLSIFANDVYKDSNIDCFKVKFSDGNEDQYTEKDKLLSARMYKAISMILFKLEGSKIQRHPEFGMSDRLLLDKINYADSTITIDGKVYPMKDTDFPTVDPTKPYELTPEEHVVIDQLTESFRHSEKLQRHVRFLYAKGGIYKVHNGNLLIHGCLPMTKDGQLQSFTIGGKLRSGREFLDYAEQTARKAYFDPRGTVARQFGLDFLWWLWAGRNSPIFGKDRMTTFERRFIADEETWKEAKNPYYRFYENPDVCDMMLHEFGLYGKHSHIINGHVPVKTKKGETPIKAGGKLLVIDGGFCKAYQPTSGIAGYTLIYNSRNMRIVSHEPFRGRQDAIHNNHDIINSDYVFEHMQGRVKIANTDQGREIQEEVNSLMDLLAAYRTGLVAEKR